MRRPALSKAKRIRHRFPEKCNERTHEKCSDDGPDSGHDAQKGSGQGTDKIRDHTDDAEIPTLFLRQRQGNGIVGGDTEISCKVERGGQAHDDNCHDQKEKADQERRIRKKALPEPGREVHHIAQKEKVDKGGDADLFSVQKKEVDSQQEHIQDHIYKAEAGTVDSFPDTVGKDLKGIQSHGRILEHSNTEACDQNSGHGHGQPAFHFTVHRSSFLLGNALENRDRFFGCFPFGEVFYSTVFPQTMDNCGR